VWWKHPAASQGRAQSLVIAATCAWSRDGQRDAMEDSTTTIQGRKRPWTVPAHASSLRRPVLDVQANARAVDGCHDERDSDYAVARAPGA